MPWFLPSSDRELLALAKSYPFESPGTSYLFRDGEARPLAGGSTLDEIFAGRAPVIGHGSNRSPAQLRRKFGRNAEIPVTRAWLGDYDVVYSAHVTQYGSIAANLRHTPGARVEVFITWLSETQLPCMHETELGGENYHFGRMAGVTLTLENGPAEELGESFVYLSTRGCLADGQSPLGLSAVPAEGRPHGALRQEAAQTLVRDRHRPDMGVDDLILTAIRDQGFRKALIAEMSAEALPAAAPHFHAMA